MPMSIVCLYTQYIHHQCAGSQRGPEDLEQQLASHDSMGEDSSARTALPFRTHLSHTSTAKIHLLVISLFITKVFTLALVQRAL